MRGGSTTLKTAISSSVNKGDPLSPNLSGGAQQRPRVFARTSRHAFVLLVRPEGSGSAAPRRRVVPFPVPDRAFLRVSAQTLVQRAGPNVHLAQAFVHVARGLADQVRALPPFDSLCPTLWRFPRRIAHEATLSRNGEVRKGRYEPSDTHPGAEVHAVLALAGASVPGFRESVMRDCLISPQ